MGTVSRVQATVRFLKEKAWGLLPVVDFPRVGAVLRHELQVLDADRLVLQLSHGVVHTLLPRCDVVLLSR